MSTPLSRQRSETRRAVGVILDEDAGEEADAGAYLAHERARLERSQRGGEHALELADAPCELLALEDVEVRERRSADCRVSRIGEAVAEDRARDPSSQNGAATRSAAMTPPSGR